MMKNSVLLIAGLLFATAGYSQKKQLDHSVYDSWEGISSVSLSERGNLLSYEINPQEGDGKLFIRNNKTKKVTEIERGYNAKILPDESHVIFKIKPRFKDTRDGKIKKLKNDKMPKDSLGILNVATGKIAKFPKLSSYGIGDKTSAVFAFMSSDTIFMKPADRKKKDLGSPLLVYHFKTAKTDTLQYISNYKFDREGKTLVFTLKEGKKKGGVGMYDVATGDTLMFRGGGYTWVSLPNFSDDGSKALLLASKDTLDSGDKSCEVIEFKLSDKTPHIIIPAGYKDNLPEGWGVNANANPYYSKDGKRIFVGVGNMLPPNNKDLVSFETAGLDIWVYDAPEIPPYSNRNKNKDVKRTYLSYYADGKLVPLTTSKYESISTVLDGNASFALSRDKTEWTLQEQWDAQTPVALSLIDLATANRTKIATGIFANVSVSPDAKYVVWYNMEERNWYCYSIAAKTIRNLTEKIGVDFFNVQYDNSSLPPSYGGSAWTTGDKELLINDQFDIWKVNVETLAYENLTGGAGRKTNRTFRYMNTKKDEVARRHLSKGEEMLFSVFDNTTMENGYAVGNSSRCAAPKVLFLGGYYFDTFDKAKYSDTYVYRKGNFVDNMDLYISKGVLKSETKITAINPQQKDYNWGTAELYHWTAYDGTKLGGILYKPEDFDENKKYPVMVYFYERNTQNLFRHYNPSPSRSVINFPFYTSRGYVVFVPDIVYTAGLPGESAYNCIVSGAESLTKYPWIDKDNMAIQGQSWGGYQVAYLITRTNMFKAAGAGAPVSNMTSAYGGIRWGTGLSRQFQYEHTQSRIGRNLWDGLDLYMANSPLFRLPNVTTPVLIMHNDNDGAVPWWQGIEMFMGLRRLGKPAWLLQYNGEAHNLGQRRNSKDLSVRLQQFFDHYLKGAPEPAWMKTGIPATRKGQYFGLEDAK